MKALKTLTAAAGIAALAVAVVPAPALAIGAPVYETSIDAGDETPEGTFAPVLEVGHGKGTVAAGEKSELRFVAAVSDSESGKVLPDYKVDFAVDAGDAPFTVDTRVADGDDAPESAVTLAAVTVDAPADAALGSYKVTLTANFEWADKKETITKDLTIDVVEADDKGEPEFFLDAKGLDLAAGENGKVRFNSWYLKDGEPLANANVQFLINADDMPLDVKFHAEDANFPGVVTGHVGVTAQKDAKPGTYDITVEARYKVPGLDETPSVKQTLPVTVTAAEDGDDKPAEPENTLVELSGGWLFHS